LAEDPAVARRLVITENVTLDGVVENDGTWFDPTEASDRGRELAAVTAEHAAASDGFLVGRTTFEEMRGFWPQQHDDQTGVTHHLDHVAKYVVSTTMDDPGWDGTTVLRGDDALEAEIRALTEAPGREIVLTGSITLAGALLRKGLVDELRLFVYPVVLGHGRRLFPQDWTASRLQLLEQRPIHDVMLLRYGIAR
jgi:dihydrofolate reductase